MILNSAAIIRVECTVSPEHWIPSCCLIRAVIREMTRNVMDLIDPNAIAICRKVQGFRAGGGGCSIKSALECKSSFVIGLSYNV